MKKDIAAKLKMLPGKTTLVLNAPEGFLSSSDRVETKSNAKTRYDVILLFTSSKAELNKFVKQIVSLATDNNYLWIAYPKKNSTIKTDLSRDYGWDDITAANFEVVSLISIDDTWSALRFKSTSKKQADDKKEKNKRKKFKALIERASEGMDAAYVAIPVNVENEYGTKGQVKIKAWFDGHPYRGVLANMGTGGHVLGIRKDIRQAIGKNIGDSLNVELELDTEERVIEIPQDLKQAFSKTKAAEQFFNSLSFTNRKEYVVWITSAKKPETRDKRLADTIKKLLSSKKNPSEK